MVLIGSNHAANGSTVLRHRQFCRRVCDCRASVLERPQERRLRCRTHRQSRSAGAAARLPSGGRTLRRAPPAIIDGDFTEAIGPPRRRAADAGRAARCDLLRQRHDGDRLPRRAARRPASRVPDEVALAGFDDIPIASYVNPPLTTAAVPIAEIGRQALDCCVELISGSVAERQRSFQPQLVIRASSRPRVSGDQRTTIRGDTIMNSAASSDDEDLRIACGAACDIVARRDPGDGAADDIDHPWAGDDVCRAGARHGGHRDACRDQFGDRARPPVPTAPMCLPAYGPAPTTSASAPAGGSSSA